MRVYRSQRKREKSHIMDGHHVITIVDDNINTAHVSQGMITLMYI